MVFEHIHREEARATDHDADLQDLHGVGPPCRQCGKRERVEGDLCEVCLEPGTQ